MALTIILAMISIPVTTNAATTESRAGVVTTSKDPLNVRSSKSTSSSIVTKLKKGAM